MKIFLDAEGLAVCIPDEAVESLELREGDEIVVHIAGDRQFEIACRESNNGVLAGGRAPAEEGIDLRNVP